MRKSIASVFLVLSAYLSLAQGGRGFIMSIQQTATNPTFAAWSTTYKGASTILSNTNHTSTNSTATGNCVVSDSGHTAPAYCEVKCPYGWQTTSSSGTGGVIGFTNNQSTINTSNYVGSDGYGWGMYGYGSGNIYHSGTTSGSGGVFYENDVIGIYYHGTQVDFYINGVFIQTVTGISGKIWIAAGFQNDQYIINGNTATQVHNIGGYYW